MSFVVEKGVPVPKRRATARPCQYPYREMEVGDSFFVEEADAARARKLQTSVSAKAASVSRRTPGLKFTTRWVDGGIRCWRTA